MSILQNAWEWICDVFSRYVAEPVLRIGVRDVVDIVLLGVVLYCLYLFLHNRRAARLLIGLSAIVILSVLVTLFELPALSYIVELFASAFFFCLVVIFQPEFRDALERLGNATLLNPFKGSIRSKFYRECSETVEETVDAVFAMSDSSTGALIVFEGLTPLGDCIRTGKPVDAKVTSHLLQNIFFDKAPLHDGALVIRDFRILAASCVLPSARANLDFGDMGTRHRAGIGITEVSDALVVIVSEETGIVSVAQNARLVRDVDRKTLTDFLMTYLAGSTYLRTKREDIRNEYLEFLDEISEVRFPEKGKKAAKGVDLKVEGEVSPVVDLKKIPEKEPKKNKVSYARKPGGVSLPRKNGNDEKKQK